MCVYMCLLSVNVPASVHILITAGRAEKKLKDGEVAEREWGGDRASREPVHTLLKFMEEELPWLLNGFPIQKDIFKQGKELIFKEEKFHCLGAPPWCPQHQSI